MIFHLHKCNCCFANISNSDCSTIVCLRILNTYIHSLTKVLHFANVKPMAHHGSCINQFQMRTSPLGQTPQEIFFEVVVSPALGQNFPAKAWPSGQKIPTLGEYVRRSSQPFLLIGTEILGFCRNQTLKRIGRLSNYCLVIPASFSLSTILEVLKFPPALKQIL